MRYPIKFLVYHFFRNIEKGQLDLVLLTGINNPCNEILSNSQLIRVLVLNVNRARVGRKLRMRMVPSNHSITILLNCFLNRNCADWVHFNIHGWCLGSTFLNSVGFFDEYSISLRIPT